MHFSAGVRPVEGCPQTQLWFMHSKNQSASQGETVVGFDIKVVFACSVEVLR